MEVPRSSALVGFWGSKSDRVIIKKRAQARFFIINFCVKLAL